VAFIYVVAR